MKKLIMTMAVVAAGSAFSVESSNVVGYNTLNTGDSTVMLGSTWEALDEGASAGSGILLKDLKGEFVDEDNLQIASVDESTGYLVFTDYYYFTSDYGYDPEGWYDGGDNYVGDTVRIPLGSAFWFSSADESAKGVTSSGQVRSTAFVHTFDETTEMVCSAFPVGFNPNSGVWTGLVDEDNIQVAAVDSSTGYLTFTDYYYFTADYGYDPEGWYTGDDQYVDSPITAVGQGFWLSVANPTEVTLTETSPVNN